MEEACMKMSSESGKALRELAASMRTMTLPCSGGGAGPHIAKSKLAAKNLKSLLKRKRGLICEEDSTGHDLVINLIPAATVASILVDVVCCTEKIDKAIQELSSLAKFKNLEPTKEEQQLQPKLNRQMAFLQQRSTSFGPHHVVTIRQASLCRHDQTSSQG